MGRLRRSDTRITFRIDSGLRDWFKEHCDQSGMNMSDVFRELLNGLRRKDQRTQRKGETS